MDQGNNNELKAADDPIVLTLDQTGSVVAEAVGKEVK
jgi:hypothetical protein